MIDQPPTTSEQAISPASQGRESWVVRVSRRVGNFVTAHPADTFCVFVIADLWLILMFALPPAHEYPIVDDWIYARSVRDMLDTGAFHMPDMSQANLVGLTVWGAAWSRIFGFSFTTLTASTLFMAAVALYAFYALARLVGVPSWGALFGTALLALNPMFVHLSYSFMTDVPFLALMLLSSVCYVRGIQTGGLNWHIWGSLFAGWSFLIRQFGGLITVVFVVYLLAEALLSRRWTWRQVAAQVAAMTIPAALIFGLWYIWIRTPLTSTSVSAAVRASAYVLREPWLRVFLLRAFNVLPLIALFAWAAVKIPRGRRWLVAASAAALVPGVYIADLPEETWIGIITPPFTAQVGPFGIDYPQEAYSFGAAGNILRVTGIDFFEYDNQEPIWSPEAWHLVWLLGAALAVLLVAAIASRSWDWLKTVRQRKTLEPVTGFYLLGLVIFVVSLAFPGDLFDRYVLGFLPFFLLFVIRGSTRWGRIAWAYSLAALVLLATFTVLVKADNIDHDNARWAAGRWMQARSGGVHVGYDWDNWTGSFSAAYQVADVQLPGFRVEQTFPYTCRLCGFTTRNVIAQSMESMPPLPEPLQ